LAGVRPDAAEHVCPEPPYCRGGDAGRLADLVPDVRARDGRALPPERLAPTAWAALCTPDEARSGERSSAVKADAIARLEPLVSLLLEAAVAARLRVSPQYAKLQTPEPSRPADLPDARERASLALKPPTQEAEMGRKTSASGRVPELRPAASEPLQA
jgi:hypothetical protein